MIGIIPALGGLINRKWQQFSFGMDNAVHDRKSLREASAGNRTGEGDLDCHEEQTG
jgi:hypothetical protein